MRTISLISTLVSPGSVYHSHGQASPPYRHVRHQGPGVCYLVEHLHRGEGEFIIIATSDNIETSSVSENPGILAAVIHLRHLTPGVCILAVFLHFITGTSHTVQDPI